MQLRVVHTTRISYDAGVAASYNLARMTPLTSSDQMVLHTRVDVAPTPWRQTYRDYWGTEVTAFEVLDQHSELTVTATSTVQVSRPSPVPAGIVVAGRAHRGDRGPVLRDARGRRPGATRRRAARAWSSASPRTRRGPSDLARRVCRLVWEEVAYQSGSTMVSGHASDAWSTRAGVCQDMAHVVIGALRSAGVPARYVSGYLHPAPDPQVGDTVVGESHAWIEWWDGDWVGFDPTNDLEPGDRHVVVARGRDYSDVPPLTGIFSGGTTSSMSVDVQVTRLT